MSNMDPTKVLQMIIEDVETDIKELEGKPFTGPVVASAFGNLAAQIQAVAKILKRHIEESKS